MDELRLRAANRADQDSVRDVVHAVLAEYELDVDPGGADADLGDLAGYYADGYFGVLEDGQGGVVGTIGLKPTPGGRLELRKMYFLPSLRGHGAGKALLDWAIRRARDEGYAQMELETARSLREAVGLYRAFGFTDDPRGAETCRCDYRFLLDVAAYRSPPGLRPIVELDS